MFLIISIVLFTLDWSLSNLNVCNLFQWSIEQRVRNFWKIKGQVNSCSFFKLKVHVSSFIRILSTRISRWDVGILEQLVPTVCESFSWILSWEILAREILHRKTSKMKFLEKIVIFLASGWWKRWLNIEPYVNDRTM